MWLYRYSTFVDDLQPFIIYPFRRFFVSFKNEWNNIITKIMVLWSIYNVPKKIFDNIFMKFSDNSTYIFLFFKIIYESKYLRSENKKLVIIYVGLEDNEKVDSYFYTEAEDVGG